MVPPGPLALRSVEESWSQWSLRRGLESLPEAIAEFLQRSGKVELHINAPVGEIHLSAAAWKVGRKAKCVENYVVVTVTVIISVCLGRSVWRTGFCQLTTSSLHCQPKVGDVHTRCSFRCSFNI